jgi:hypothetical protein
MVASANSQQRSSRNQVWKRMGRSRLIDLQVSIGRARTVDHPAAGAPIHWTPAWASLVTRASVPAVEWV